MKKAKVCDICSKRFLNRKHLRNHLMIFHDVFPFRFKPTPPAEGKPLRRVRMMQNAARIKKERDHVARKALKHGVRKTTTRSYEFSGSELSKKRSVR